MKVKFSEMVRSQEFASQLCKLYNTFQTKNPKQEYVNTWLTTALSDVDTTVATFPKIKKKMRDEATGMSDSQQSYIDPNIKMCKGNYFQRSSFYMAIKVFLQLSLTAELGEENGLFIYKLIMLNFMAEFCEIFENPYSFSTLNADLMRQFLAKMARRIEKLSLMKSGHSEENICMDVVNKTKCTISNIRIKIDQKFQRIYTKSKFFPELRPLDHLNFKADIHQKIRYLRPYLEKRKSSNEKKNIYSVKVHFKTFKRHDIRHKTPPSMKSFDECEEEIERHLILTDFENWILYRNLDFSKVRSKVKTLLECGRKYIRIPEEFHIGDPFGISKMVLVRLKLIAMIDQIVTEMYPLLFEHRSGIDPAIFDVLVLPQLIDKKIALELQKYFIQRNANASYPGLIEHDTVLSSSFPVRFAMRSDEMQSARREIHERSRERIEQKRGEWEKGRAKVELLRRTARTMSHDHSDGEKILEYEIDCQLCEMQDKISRVKIDQYEYALPNSEDEQNSIIFELRLPPEIGALRDVLHNITRLRQNRFETVGSMEDWIVTDQLENHNQSGNKWSRGINLGFKTSISVDSLHVDNDFSYFVVENRSNCLYHVSYLKIFPSIDVEGVKRLCTLNLDPCYPYGIGFQGEYKIAFQKHNEFVARQSKNPQNPLLFELEGFHTLRVDDQLRKLYAIIEIETFSFDQQSELGPILQIIWKLGTINDNFIDLDITKVVIELLKEFVENQKENWAHPIKLLLITFITVRIYELNANESTADQLVDVLNEIRDVAIDWFEKIQQKLNKLENPTLANEQSLRLLLVTASITGAMTFFVNSKHRFFNKIFNTNPLNGCTALQAWLLSIVTLNRNILLEGQVLTESISILRMLVRLVRYTAIHIEWKIQEIIQKNPSDVFDLIKEEWSPAVKGEFKEFNFSEKCPQVFLVYVEIEEITKHVTIDVITGSLLINNLPIARLPENITSNSLFRYVFGGSILEVQPDTRNNFISTHKYNECIYEFGWINVTELIITEHGKDEIELELIPNNALRDGFPSLLVENYSHWWCKQKNQIEFRPKIFESKPFSESPVIEFTLNLNTSRLVQNDTNAYMLDVNSPSYKRIQAYLERLEFYRYIHVFVKDDIATAEMVRFKLKFIIDISKLNAEGRYDLMSNEYSGMRISLQQNCGTLYGLNDGLLLESVPNENSQLSSKLLLLPYARFSSTYEYPDLHARVYINIYCSENPPFHRYQVDETMRQLKPCDNVPSAWIFLAYLHATTSHGEIEPLTGMSGTERALQILHLNVVRSMTPYAPDVMKILKLIGNLSTERNLSGNSQLTVESDWPCYAPDHCSQDSFIFIVRELMNEAQCLDELHINSNDIFAYKDRKSLELNKRSYLRCLQLQPQLRVDDVFIDDNESPTTLPKIPPISYSSGGRLISSLHNAKTFAVPENFDLKKFLTNSKELDGLIHVENVLHILDHNVYKSLTNMWLSLYEVARKRLQSREQFGLIWSLLSHENTNDEQFKAILALQAIACNPDQFMGSDCDPPQCDNYEISKGLFDEEKVSNILKSCYMEPVDFNNDEKWSDADRDKYERKVISDTEQLTKFVASHWPCNYINLESVEYIKSTEILLSEANSKLNVELRIWNNNRNLFDFIEKIEGKLRKLRPLTVIQPSDFNISHSQALNSHPKYKINFETMMLANIKTIIKISEETAKIWLENEDSNRSALEWWKIHEHVLYLKGNKHLVDAGIFPRIIPSFVLPRITSKITNSKLKEIIGALAISIAREQWQNRIKTFECQPEQQQELDQELENEPHINWKPCEHPEWLLFEIEQNVTLRQDHIKIAKQMIGSTHIGTKGSVMQLNVDDHKNDVVVSILALNFANGKQTCEVVVPKSHFKTYLNLLRKNLGGMLNRRIYTLPYRHEKPTKNFIQELLNIYQKCQIEKGRFSVQVPIFLFFF